MLHKFPMYEDLDLSRYGEYQGSSFFAMVREVCEDMDIVCPHDWQSYVNYDWLEQRIEQSLRQGLCVLLVPDEEEFICHANPHAKQVLDRYQDQPVWLVTQMEGAATKTWLDIGVLEMPWVLFELTERYYAASNRLPAQAAAKGTAPNFLCMTRRLEPHKEHLVRALHQRGLTQHGLMLVAPDMRYPAWMLTVCKRNTQIPDPPATGVYLATKLIEPNLQNFLNFEQVYSNIPLVVHAETGCGVFYNTEKSLWPLLLGKMMLTFGPPGNTAYISKFYDFDIGRYARLDFDLLPTVWSMEAHHRRLELMLDHNMDLIRDCSILYQQCVPEIESARWSMGRNFYQSMIQQIGITRKELA